MVLGTPCGSITVHMGPFFFVIQRFLRLKDQNGERFTINLVGPYGLVWVSKPWLRKPQKAKEVLIDTKNQN